MSNESKTSQASLGPCIDRRAFCGMALMGGLGLIGLPGGRLADAAESADKQGGTAASDAQAEPVKASTFAFNTLVNITAYGVDADVVASCIKDCAMYEDLFSARKEGAEIVRINEAGGEPVEVSADTADLIAAGLEYGRQTDGAFDITIGSVSLLWDFINAVKPTDEEIAEGLKHIDYTQVVLDGTTVTMGDPEARLDLGGIAKGWIAARLVDKLEQAGCTSGLVDLGTSSVYAIGSKPDGSPWRVGLRDPKDSMSSLAGVVEVCDEAITSSGSTGRSTGTSSTRRPAIRLRRTCSASRSSAPIPCRATPCPPPCRSWASRRVRHGLRRTIPRSLPCSWTSPTRRRSPMGLSRTATWPSKIRSRTR